MTDVAHAAEMAGTAAGGATVMTLAACRRRMARPRACGPARLPQTNVILLPRLRAEWEACYRAEMPQLIRYLMKCFAESDNPRDAADAAQGAFR